MTTVWAYCRISTPLQDMYIESQWMKIQEYCRFKNFALGQVYKEIGSGKDIDRPTLLELLDQIPKGEIVAVTDLTRLSTSIPDCLKLLKRIKEKGAKFISLHPEIDTTTPIGEMTLETMLALNQFEKEPSQVPMSEKGLRQIPVSEKKEPSEVKYAIRTPFGYSISLDGLLEPDPQQQRIIEKVRRLHAGKLGYAAIAEKLNRDGDNVYIRTSGPECFDVQTIGEIMMRWGSADD